MFFAILAFIGFLQLVNAHASIWHPSMWGFNVTQQTYSYDNRPVAPLANYTFSQWWFHGHLDHPPHPEDFFELPAGQNVTTEIACNKGATSFFASSEGGDIRQGDNVCPNSPTSEYHTNGPDDLKGCALAIAYKSDVNQVQPEDFTVFSVNQTCVWTRFTDFQVPAAMPPCPAGGCICAWFWIHSQDSGSEQNYMNGFQCNITGSTSNVPLAAAQVPRRCGADPDNGKPNAAPGNCTYGAKQPLYWFQAERNNMFEGQYAPPFYLDLYNFKDGSQDDIFQNSYPNGIPPPSPNSTVIPTPVPFNAAAVPAPTSVPSSSAISSTPSSAIPTSTGITQASPTSSPSASATSTSPSAGPSASISPVSAPPSPVSIVVSTSVSVVVSTQVVTVTASPSATRAAVTAPPVNSSPPPSAASTVTEYSVVLVTVTGSPPVATPTADSDTLTSSGAVNQSAPSDAPVRATGSSTAATNAVTTIELNTPSATPASDANTTTSQPQRIADVDDLSINEAVVTSFANITALQPSANTSESSSSQTCKRQDTQSASNLTKRSFFTNIPGLNSHRKWKRQPSLWQLLSPIPF